nr:MAG TPA: hypothetical protein [Caudoviricetes sp.]DAZ70665.1 MAG TPA: hypothetical protein [Caudoviricetes sp.]
MGQKTQPYIREFCVDRITSKKRRGKFVILCPTVPRLHAKPCGSKN